MDRLENLHGVLRDSTLGLQAANGVDVVKVAGESRALTTWLRMRRRIAAVVGTHGPVEAMASTVFKYKLKL